MKKTFILTIATILVFVIGFYFGRNFQSNTTPPPQYEAEGEVVISKVTFVCDSSKSITATFYIGDDRFVDLELSDGRIFSVPHAISASGARYANADESFVFWNKGDKAFITEGKLETPTYENCIIK